jgi:hypothetical protein
MNWKLPNPDIGTSAASAVCQESNFSSPAHCPPLYWLSCHSPYFITIAFEILSIFL